MLASHRQRHIGRSATGALLAVAMLLTSTACVQDPDFHEDEDLRTLLEAYRQRNAALQEQRRAREAAAIRRLEVVRAADDAGFLVSVDLAGAPLSRVVGRILDLTAAPFNLTSVRLTGTATARFSGLPLTGALNQLLNPHGVSVATQDGVLVFRHGGQIDPGATGLAMAAVGEDGQPADEAGNQPLYMEVGLQNLSAADAVTLLKDLYDGDDDDDDDDAPSVTFGSLAELNTVYLAGQRRAVLDGVALLSRADREVPHVLIEALVVELDVTAAVAIGTDITNAASGEFGNISLLPGGVGGNISFSFLEGAVNPTQLSVLIDLLVSQDKAQILSRPYLAALSNHQATIEIAEDRFVAVEESDSGASITSPDSISAGVKLQITPVVAGDGMIRVDLQVEESEFEPTVGDVLVQKDRNTAQTAMNVRSGQTIVVGGLNVRRLATANSGPPWLRRIPLLNVLLAKQESLDQNKEVVVYLTPRIWTPALDSPLDEPHLPGVDSRPLTDLERLEGILP